MTWMLWLHQHESLPPIRTSSAWVVIQVNLAWKAFFKGFFFQAFYGFNEDKYKMLRELEFNPMWTRLASSDFYRTSQELNYISLLNHTATRNSKNDMNWTCALISELWIMSPCQCDSQGRAAMCRPAADHIKHGWLVVWLTDGKHGTLSQAFFDVRDAQHVIHTTAFFPPFRAELVPNTCDAQVWTLHHWQ